MNKTDIIHRLLDPTPLTDEEVQQQVQSCFIETGTFINFHHPLYVGMYLELPELSDVGSEEQAKIREAMRVEPKLKAKHQYVNEEGRSLEGQLVMFERAYRSEVATILLLERRLADEMTTEELRSSFLWLWTDTEFPSRTQETWLHLFHSLRERLQPPFGDLLPPDHDDSITVYRGLHAEDPDEVLGDGLSWTTSRDIAEWYSRRLLEDDSVPIVLTGEIAWGDVWFATNQRSEMEVVSDAVMLKEVESA